MKSDPKGNPTKTTPFYSAITKKDQRVYVSLAEMWTKADRPKQFTFLLPQLKKIIGESWSDETLIESLFRLKQTPITWEHSTVNKMEIVTFTILSEITIQEDEVCSITFHPFLVKNELGEKST